MHSRVISNLSGLSPLNAYSTSPRPVRTTKNISGLCQTYPEGGGQCAWQGGGGGGRLTTVRATTSARFVAMKEGSTENEPFRLSFLTLQVSTDGLPII